jgi:pyruvate,water dikinase
MSALVRTLDDPGPLSACGGKALNLGRMRKAGLPVPPGVVVTTEGYRRLVEGAGLAPTLDAAWAALAADPDSAERRSAELRAAFEAAALPPELVEAVVRACAGWFAANTPLAVRSSATAEDLADASFAGQQDSYLNVVGREAVLAAVLRCHASLWTARAMTYRLRQGLGPAEVALAVVIQELVPARVAGVLFTVHPLSGDPAQVVLNASWGLGEALVGGRVSPDAVVARKSDGVVLRVDLGAKDVMTASTGPGGGTSDVPVDDQRRGARALTDVEVAALVAAGRQLEVLFGGPQDVEWALDGDRVVLLQSRAVTTAVPGDDAWPPRAAARSGPSTSGPSRTSASACPSRPRR